MHHLEVDIGDKAFILGNFYLAIHQFIDFASTPLQGYRVGLELNISQLHHHLGLPFRQDPL